MSHHVNHEVGCAVEQFLQQVNVLLEESKPDQDKIRKARTLLIGVREFLTLTKQLETEWGLKLLINEAKLFLLEASSKDKECSKKTSSSNIHPKSSSDTGKDLPGQQARKKTKMVEYFDGWIGKSYFVEEPIDENGETEAERHWKKWRRRQ